MSVVEEQKTYTCKLTIVNPGFPDAVLKIHPSDGPEEKVWTDNTPGKERKEEIDRFLQNYALRGSRVPRPVPYHSDTSQAIAPDLREENIPTVQLEPGVVFQTKKPEPRVPSVLQTAQQKEDSARIASLEGTVNQLAQTLQAFMAGQQGKPASNGQVEVEEPRKPGRPKKQE